MGQSGGDTLHYGFGLGRVGWHIRGKSIQNVDDPPLITVVHGSQQLLHHVTGQPQQRLSLTLTADHKSRHSVRHHHGITIVQKVLQDFDEALFLYQLGGDLVQLGDAHHCCLPYIRILILEGHLQWIAQILRDLFDSNAAHGPHCQGSQERVGFVSRVLDYKSHLPSGSY